MIMPASKARTRVEKKLKKNCKKQKRILISAINKEIKKPLKMELVIFMNTRELVVMMKK